MPEAAPLVAGASADGRKSKTKASLSPKRSTLGVQGRSWGPRNWTMTGLVGRRFPCWPGLAILAREPDKCQVGPEATPPPPLARTGNAGLGVVAKAKLGLWRRPLVARARNASPGAVAKAVLGLDGIPCWLGPSMPAREPGKCLMGLNVAPPLWPGPVLKPGSGGNGRAGTQAGPPGMWGRHCGPGAKAKAVLSQRRHPLVARTSNANTVSRQMPAGA